MDDVVTIVAIFALGLGFVSRGLWTKVTGGPLVIKSTGRNWRTPGRAAAFWLLIGCGLLAAALLRMAGAVGFIGVDAAFWWGLLPFGFCGLALIGFWPRHPPQAVGR